MDSFPGSFDLIVNSHEFDFGPFQPILNGIDSHKPHQSIQSGFWKTQKRFFWDLCCNLHRINYGRIFEWFPVYFAGKPGVTRYVGSDEGYITG